MAYRASESLNDGLQIYRRYDSGESSQCRYWDHACYSALEQAGIVQDVIDIVPFDGMTLDSKPTERRQSDPGRHRPVTVPARLLPYGAGRRAS